MSAAVQLLQLWLTLFLGVVGGMKGIGKLLHPLSTTAGPLEAAGAIMQLPLLLRPLFAKLQRKESVADRLSIIGCYLFLVGLGVILSTYKRKGVVCWSQAVLTAVFLCCAFPQPPPDAPPAGASFTTVAAAAAATVGGATLGSILQVHESLEAMVVHTGIPVLVTAAVATFGPYWG